MLTISASLPEKIGFEYAGKDDRNLLSDPFSRKFAAELSVKSEL